MNLIPSEFDQAFAFTIGAEGGYSNDPKDPGSETNYGISKRQYPSLDIPNITLEGAKGIYRVDYWNVIRGDDLHPVLASFLFDFAVNSGTRAASVALQKAVGALPDGRVGPKTLALVSRLPLRQILRLVFVDRACIMANSPVRDRYEHGWFARLYDVTEVALLRLGGGKA